MTKQKNKPLIGHCEDCGMMLDSRYNDFDVDDIVSGYYIGPDGQGLCRYHKDDYEDDEDDEGEFEFTAYLKPSKVEETSIKEDPTDKKEVKSYAKEGLYY